MWRELDRWGLVCGEVSKSTQWLNSDSINRSSSFKNKFEKPQVKQLDESVYYFGFPHSIDAPSLFKHSAGTYTIFCGVLHNRKELILKLSLPSNSDCSSAEIIAQGYEQLGESLFADLNGSYSCIIYSVKFKTVVAFTDRLGDCRLYYGQIDKSVIIGSSPQTLLSTPGFKTDINDVAIVNYFINRTSYSHHTNLLNLHTIIPGHFLKISAQGISKECYWKFSLNKGYWGLDHQDVVEKFKKRLDTAVSRRINKSNKMAILMSGGMDSTSIAALASNQVESEAELLTVSLVFDHYKSCDERQYIRSMNKKLAVEHMEINGDDVLPLSGDLGQLHQHPNMIWISPMVMHHRKIWSLLSTRGIKKVLSGEYGDHLFAGSLYWLRDLLKGQMSITTFLSAIRHQLNKNPSPWYADTVLRRVLPFNGITGGRFNKKRSFLTSYSNALFKQEQSDNLLESEARYERDRFEICLNQRSSQLVSVLRESAADYGLNIMFPYRDYDLVEFVLNLPAYFFYDYKTGYNKYILRESMTNILPDEVRLRTSATDFSEIFRDSLLHVHKHILKEVLFDQSRVWPKYVDEKYLLSRFNQTEPSDEDVNLFWNCLCFEVWYKRIKTI